MLYPILVVCALSLLALIPLAQRHFFASSDGLYHVYRAVEIGQCLQDGAWVCRWAPTQFLGYGTPLFNFYSPFIYYVTNVFHWLGLGWVNATRAMTGLFLLASALFAYLYAAEWLSRRAAVVAAVAYVYVPYHLVNAYYRGDLPEFAAMAWFPSILWTFSRLARPVRGRRDFVWFPLAALCYGLLIVTHNLSAFIYTGVLFVYCLWLLVVNRLEGNYRSIVALFWPGARLLGATLLAFALSAFLSIPALWEKDLVTLEGLLYVSHTDHFPTLQQILPNSIVHGYGIIFPDSPVYAYKMGLVQVLLGGLGTLAAALLWRRFGWRARGEAVISLVLFGLAFYFTQPPSLWLWNSIPLLPHAQFPWRFLLLMALPTSLMVGYLVDAGPERWRRWITPPLVAFVLLTNLLGLKPIMANAQDGEIDLRSSVEFELLYHLMGTTVAGEYIPRTVVDRPFVNPSALAWVLDGQVEPTHPTAHDRRLAVELLSRKATEAVYSVRAEQAGTAVFNIVSFPYWRAQVDGSPAEAVPNQPQGLVSVQVPQGEHTVRLYFENTPLRTRSELITLFALLVLMGALVYALLPWRQPAAAGASSAPRVAARLPRRPALNASMALAAVPFLVVLVGLPLGARVFADSYRPPPVAQFPIKIDLGATMQLLGYDQSVDGQPLQRRQAASAGGSVDLAIYWRPLESAERAAGSKVYARLSNIDEQQWSQAVEHARETLADGLVQRSLVRLPIPPAQPPGVYQIDVGAFGRDGRPLAVRNMEMVELLPTQGSVRLGPLHVRAADGSVPPLRLSVGANFGNAVQLESYDVAKGVNDRRLLVEPIEASGANGALRAASGDTLQLDFVWRALRANPGHYLMSASLVDEQGFKWAVRDAEPADGMFPTWMWAQGQSVRDQLRMPVPPETPPGRYRLALRVIEPDGKPLSLIGPNGSPAGGQASLVEVELSRTEVAVKPREIRGVTSRSSVKLNDDLEIAASDYGRAELRPGESTDVTLIWRALRDVRRDYGVRLSLLGPNNASFGQLGPIRLAGELNQTDNWERDDYFRGQFRLMAGAAARPGTARLGLELIDLKTSEVVATNHGLAEVRVLERAGGTAPLALKNQVEFAFGPAIQLVGFELKPDSATASGLRATEPLHVSLLWRAESEPGAAYKVTVQLLDSDGKLVAQHDGEPDQARAPTSGWVRDLRVLDEHRIELPKELAGGEYRLIVGLYDSAGQRLALPDGQNTATLASIRVR